MTRRRIRVVHVTDSLGPGGAEHNLVNLLAAGDREAFDHHVVALYRDDALAGRLREAGARVTVLGGSGLRDAPRLLVPLVSLLSESDPELVHTQLVLSDVLGRAATLLGGRRWPTLSTLQNRSYDPEAIGVEMPSKLVSNLIRLADRWLGRLARTRYIAVSSSVRSSYVRELGIRPEWIEVIHNSVDVASIRKQAASQVERIEYRAALGAGQAPLLLNVARHTPQKGLSHLLAAMRSDRVRATGARLLLVGTGPDTPALRDQISALDLGTTVSLLGRRSDVPALMRASDLFVLPSIYEGLPLALLEAMAVGLPVVATDLPEIREAVTEQGAALVPVGKPELLAAAIVRLITVPEAANAVAREGRVQVETRFDLPQNVARFEGLMRSMIPGASLPR